jgi:hypothetical protein
MQEFVKVRADTLKWSYISATKRIFPQSICATLLKHLKFSLRTSFNATGMETALGFAPNTFPSSKIIITGTIFMDIPENIVFAEPERDGLKVFQ